MYFKGEEISQSIKGIGKGRRGNTEEAKLAQKTFKKSYGNLFLYKLPKIYKCTHIKRI